MKDFLKSVFGPGLPAEDAASGSDGADRAVLRRLLPHIISDPI